jgi:hypothetical protein
MHPSSTLLDFIGNLFFNFVNMLFFLQLLTGFQSSLLILFGIPDRLDVEDTWQG